MYLFESVLCDYMPKSGSVGSLVVLLFFFLGSSIMFSIVATPTYNPTNSVGRSPFLHILCSI